MEKRDLTPQTLTTAFGRHVPSTSRTRGDAYVRQRRVTIVHSDAASVSATVRGAVPYDVTLAVRGDAFRVTCTCPVFEQIGDVCKHIWATMVVADANALLRVPPGAELDVDAYPLGWLDDEDEEDGALDHGAPPGAPARDDRVLDHLRQAADRAAGRGAGRPSSTRTRRPRRPTWETFLSSVTPAAAPGPSQPVLASGELVYIFDPLLSRHTDGLHIETLVRDRRKDGSWGKPRPISLARNDLPTLPDPRDRNVLERVCGAMQSYGSYGGYSLGAGVPSSFVLNATLQRDLVPLLCATGRFLLRYQDDPYADATPLPIAWDATPTTLRVRVTPQPDGSHVVDAVLAQADVAHTLADALFVTSTLVLWRRDADADADAATEARMSPLDTTGSLRWLSALMANGPITVPAAGQPRLLEQLAMLPGDRVEAPPTLRLEQRTTSPVPIARLTRQPGGYGRTRLDVTTSFAYGTREVQATSPQPVVVDTDARVAWRRDLDAERAAVSRLLALGVRRVNVWPKGAQLELSDTLLPTLVRTLTGEGWRVEADGRIYRHLSSSAFEIRSGIDWFELHGQVAFGDEQVDLPMVLQAAARGERYVRLGDGSVGLLPEDWLARQLGVASLGSAEGDHLRYAESQAALLDAWLAAQPSVSYDATFAARRDELARFDGVHPQDPPPTFTGTLRGYQKDALGWFAFLRRFGLGGCLADEMGLGKTVMVLAALDARRTEMAAAGDAHRPSLIVVPRSLVFNWLREAARFAPGLRMLDASGPRARGALARAADHDVLVVTYATLRRDIAELKEMRFDHVILDEAQAIKNASTAAAKASRLLQARHRLALSGTPVENHLGELWSLFEFLNPGLLGAASAFTRAGLAGAARDEEMLAMLARGLRPFILRRTKEQVASDLPPRTEQTLYCDLEPPQRRLYDQLRTQYRASLLGKVATQGLGRSKLQILEALLRLRQAACHPGLVDPARAHEPSAKLDVLLPRLLELVDDGRKVLVFSQFTSLLALVRTRLDQAGMPYEYLDGRTRDREARVRRFQDTDCPLFLISLKAGGLGLNLTAAEYVFLLDPWWNPAVEAQAIDRAHRIGQTRSVFAWRLIARDTVEEKVLELQATKRDLADAVVRADEALLRELKREDLELLLS